MEKLRRLKKGEILYRENDVTNMIWVVQSGKISLAVERGGKKYEVMTVGPGQVLGEQAIFTNARQMFTAEAMQEVKLMEVPVEVLKTQFTGSPAGMKLILKSMVDEARAIRTTVRALKMEQEKSPCPSVSIPRIFSLLNLVARHTGKANPENKNEIIVDWSTLKLYTMRMFAESPQRMRGLLDLLTKLGHCHLESAKTEEGEEELKQGIVHNIQLIEDFAEFYQYNLYKGSYAEVIHVDTLALKVAKVLAGLAEGLEVDRRGAVSVTWDKVLEECRAKGFELKNTHLDVLEKKGLFVKRQTHENQPATLQYDKVEYLRMSVFWAIIHEIDKWNDKGFVDLNEKEAKADGQGHEVCPSCQSKLEATHKFCPGCGQKVAAAA